MHVDPATITRRPLCTWDVSHKDKKRTHWRYLDGKKIAMKNGQEKFVVVQEEPEWDGGSRGKVKTKGKRGKGFV